MVDSETGRWVEVLEAHRGTADCAINAWQMNLSGIGRVWVELDEPVTVRVPETAAVPSVQAAS